MRLALTIKFRSSLTSTKLMLVRTRSSKQWAFSSSSLFAYKSSIAILPPPCKVALILAPPIWFLRHKNFSRLLRCTAGKRMLNCVLPILFAEMSRYSRCWCSEIAYAKLLKSTSPKLLCCIDSFRMFVFLFITRTNSCIVSPARWFHEMFKNYI